MKMLKKNTISKMGLTGLPLSSVRVKSVKCLVYDKMIRFLISQFEKKARNYVF